MTSATHSRRDFSRIFAQSLAAAIVVPTLSNPNTLDAPQSNPMPVGPIRLNFNENPYGPSPKARAASADCAPSPIAIPTLLIASSRTCSHKNTK